MREAKYRTGSPRAARTGRRCRLLLTLELCFQRHVRWSKMCEGVDRPGGTEGRCTMLGPVRVRGSLVLFALGEAVGTWGRKNRNESVSAAGRHFSMLCISAAAAEMQAE